SAANAYAVDVEYLLKKGNTEYQNKRYEQAITDYEEIIRSGYEGLSVYYNLGNSYYRTGNIGMAILNYERALKIEPNDEDVLHNLAVANALIADRIEPLPKLFIFEWFDGLVDLFSLSAWTFITYFFYLLVLSSIALYFFSGKFKLQRISFFTGIGSAALMLFFALILFIKANKEMNESYAIVISSAVTVKTSPDSQSSDAFIIHEGLKIKLEDEIAGWCKIKLSDGKLGWMSKESLAVI
ncbi:MAG TPA: tetratricopeptide repeat protein, partial [Ignavibacteriales bacterium]|nr:tetratricopeptide repeat protein [Ignavibacteriales bacterium]